MKEENKNFRADISLSDKVEDMIIYLDIFDKNIRRYIYHEQVPLDITPKINEFAATVDKCLYDPKRYGVIGKLKRNRFTSSISVECKLHDLETGDVVKKCKSTYDFKELYMRFKGQSGSEWENEISAIVYGK